MKNFLLFFLTILSFAVSVNAQGPVGAVYAMSNGEGQVDGIVQGPNSIVAYLQAEDGTLSLIGSYPTGGNGGDFDGGEGLDPLISAYAITKTNDNRFVLAVNAGSNTVTSMSVNGDYSLTAVNTQPTQDVGPNSIAYVPSRRLGINGIVYVSNISRQEFVDMGEPAQQGSVTGYWLLDNGMLVPIANSRRELANRPSAVQISPDGDFLVVTSINSGSSALANLNEDEVVVYSINADGTLSDQPTGVGASTLRGNPDNRNLPSAIGFQIVGDNYVVVTEAREFRADGTPPVFPGLQDGSVSTWQIQTDGSLEPISMDVASGVNNTGRTACWLDFSDENTFFVSNAIEAGLASYSFNEGVVELIDQTAAQGTGATGNTTDGASAFATTDGWIDLSISDDGRFLYQAYGLTGEVGVFAINGRELTLLQEMSGDLPANNIQGIISVGVPSDATNPITARYRVTFDALWNEAAFPTDFPADEPNIARFSPVAGLTHNSNVRLFEEGAIASPGLVEISQSGSRDPLDSELADVILGGDGQFYIESNTRVRPSPDTISTTFEISETHPLVSLTSMIAPSPDWIVAVRDLNLFQNGDFVESKVVQFIPYDTGSDSGESYASDNQNTDPREPITRITDGVLSVDGRIASIGMWRFERIDSESTCNLNGGTLGGGPFEFCAADGNPDFISAAQIVVSGTVGPNNRLIITDDQGFIAGLPTSIADVDFNAPGVKYIYNVAFEAGLTGMEVGNNIAELTGCFNLSNAIMVNTEVCTNSTVGAVYAMSNGEGQVDGIVQGPNSIVAYAQAEDGSLSLVGSYPTGGNGGDFDGGEGLDPLISAYAITKTNDNRFVLAVNAGSNTVTSMAVNSDYSLTAVNTQPTLDVGPNSIAYVPSRRAGINGMVYVSNISRQEFVAMGEPAQQGSVTGYWLLDNGMLVPIADSRRELANRPSAVQISPDGDFLVVTSINSGSSALANLNEDEVVVYAINRDGTLSDEPRGTGASTLRGNAENRNLPSAIGFQIVGDNYVVVTEAREFRADGTPPVFPGLQDGSVSTWQIQTDGSLEPISMDVASGVNNTGRTACWLDFSDENTFFVSNAIEAGLASYSFNNGVVELLDQTAAQGTGATGNTTDGASAFATTDGWIDLSISDDGRYLYQAYGLTGEVGVFAINGTELTLLQEVSGDLPTNNIQGIISVGVPADATNPVTARYRVTFDALWNEAAFPTDFPADEPNIARFSPVAGLTHNANVRLFEEGTIASQGLVNISQSGSRDPLDSELANVILGGDGQFYVESDTRVRPSPDTISTTFDISETHPLVSLTSMIAPSPDWIVAVRDLNLLGDDGDFVERKIVQFIPYDTGSDSGTSYASDNQNTDPREPITRITDGVLSNNGQIASIGVWRFERIDSESTCNMVGGNLRGGPFNFCADGSADFISASALRLEGANGTNNQIIVTNDQGWIIATPDAFTDVDFDAEGVHYIYNLAYEDGVTGAALGNNIADLRGCFDLSNAVMVNTIVCGDVTAVGAVYAMTNGEGQVPGVVQGPNSIVAYAQAEDGTLTRIGNYPTGGNGGDFDGGEGLDPLISAYAITKTPDNRFVLAVNAGSNTITAMSVSADDYSLTVTDTQSTIDEGPNSIAFVPRDGIDGVAGLVYVSNITRTEFLAMGEPAQQGTVTGYWLTEAGALMPIADSRRELANRPSAIQFSPNGDFAVVASINSGSSALASGSEDEIVVYAVNADGTLSNDQLSGATSTLRGNTEGRNLPSAIGFQIVGDNYVVVTEAREFRPDGTPPVFPGLQDGSVSTWQIAADGSLTPIDMDVASGENNTGRTACWLDFSDENTFFVSNAIEAGLAAFSFDDGSVELINQVAYQGVGATGNTTDPASAFGTTEGWIDLWISDDGRYLYQAYGLAGTVGVFEINGTELTLLQEATGDLPLNNIQGIVSVGEVGFISATEDLPTISAEELSLSIFPNPSTGDNLQVEFILDEESDYSVTIQNIQGQVLSRGQITGRGLEGTNTFSMASLPFDSGFYILQLELENGLVNKKFIIQK